jgi:uncharacterized iron-regulated protein
MTAKIRPSILVWLACASPAFAQPDLLDLEIGSPDRREREISVQLDTILDTATNDRVSPRSLAEQLGRSRIVLVGEEHTGHEFHAIQLRVLELLHAAGISLTVGLEMIPVDKQAALDAWIAGELDEQSFLETSDWYRVWGYNWGYYRDIFLFARQHGIPMYALRANENDADSADIVAVPPSNEQRMLMAAFFEADSPVHGGLSPGQLDSLVVAQTKRDAAMAQRVVEAVDTHPERTMVLLAGTGHVLYELGIVAQLPERVRSSAATILPVPAGEESMTARASVADFLWGIPDSDHPRYPDLGVITMQADDGLRVIHVEPESPGGKAGLTVGDVLTRFAGTDLDARRDLSATLATLSWSDEVNMELLREDEHQELVVAFRR